MKSFFNEWPFKTVISLLEINLDSYLRASTSFGSHGMDNFLCHNDIISTISIHNEAALAWVNQFLYNSSEF